MADINTHLGQLATMSSADLSAEWRRLYRQEPPRLHPDLMRHALAYTVQERVLGKLPMRIARLLTASPGASPPPARLTPGTQLIRTWNGRTIAVLVTDDGFSFEGRAYRSLSAIAREVTGAHWSGPRFFGLARG